MNPCFTHIWGCTCISIWKFPLILKEGWIWMNKYCLFANKQVTYIETLIDHYVITFVYMIQNTTVFDNVPFWSWPATCMGNEGYNTTRRDRNQLLPSVLALITRIRLCLSFGHTWLFYLSFGTIQSRNIVFSFVKTFWHGILVFLLGRSVYKDTPLFDKKWSPGADDSIVLPSKQNH